MSKNKFEAPISKIVYIEASNVLTTSPDAFDVEWVPLCGGTPDNLVF